SRGFSRDSEKPRVDSRRCASHGFRTRSRPCPRESYTVTLAISSGTCRKRDDCDRRSEEHTSELQSLAYLVCRLLLEKKKKQNKDKIDHKIFDIKHTEFRQKYVYD